MATTKSRGPLLGLLAMFGAAASGTLPKFSVNVPSKTERPAHVSEYLKARAKAKRLRRATNPHASAYARANA